MLVCIETSHATAKVSSPTPAMNAATAKGEGMRVDAEQQDHGGLEKHRADPDEQRPVPAAAQRDDAAHQHADRHRRQNPAPRCSADGVVRHDRAEGLQRGCVRRVDEEKTRTTTHSQVRELNSVQPVRRSVRVLVFSSRAECETGSRASRTAPAR